LFWYNIFVIVLSKLTKRGRISYGVRAAKLRSNCAAAMWMLKETNLEMKYQINKKIFFLNPIPIYFLNSGIVLLILCYLESQSGVATATAVLPPHSKICGVRAATPPLCGC